ncbi:MAG: hypothetical protein IKG99_02575 [Bacteroidaceae bacterium]|nr:hypothetical protein [Bacteroidaceae bacterium]
MKQKLLLAAMLLGGSLTASAQWAFPEPETTGFSIVDGTYSTDTMYLYNPGAKCYFIEGNDWGTRASTAASGLKVYFEQFIEDPEDPNWDGSTYLIWDYSLAKGEWRNLFIDSETAMYVDHGSQGENCWHFQIQDNGSTFRIFAAEDSKYNHSSYPGSYVGIVEDLDGNIANIISPLLNPDEIDATREKAYHIDWAFVTKEAYEKQQALVPTYEAAMELKAAIDQAEAGGIDVSAEKTVFNNTSSTVEELKAATESARKKIANNIELTYSPTNPLNMDADYVINTEFADASLWEYTTGAQNHGTARNKTDEAGRDGNFYFTGTFWENWHPSSYTGKLYRQMTQMPHGVYRLELAAFTNAGFGSYIYLNGDSTEVTFGSPEAYQVLALVEETDTVEIGLKVVYPANWTGIDNCHLTYYGNSDASFAYLMAQKAALNVIPDDAYYQKSAKEAYLTAVAATSAPTGAADAAAKVKTLDEAWVVFKANLDAYQALKDAWDEAEKALELGYVYGEMSDYAMDVEDMLEDGLLTTEEANANAQTLKGYIEEAYKHTPIEGEILLFTNLNFNNANTGWKVDQTTVNGAVSDAPAVAGLSINPNGERWNANFDYYQEVSGLENGVYRLTAQAFYRTGSNAAAESGRETDEVLAWLYLNGSKKTIHNIMDTYRNSTELYNAVNQDITGNCYQRTDVTDAEGNPVFTPNGQNSASAFFQLGDYQNEVYGVVTDGTMRIGIMSEGSIGDRWTLFDNFHVYWKGMDEGILSDILAEMIASAEELAESGMAAPTNDALKGAISTGKSALTGSGKEMFDAIQGLEAAVENAKASIKLYEDLRAVYNEFMTALETAGEEGTGTPEAFDAADKLDVEIADAMENFTWSDEEVEAKIAETKGVISELKKPAEIASDDNPVDYTSYITNPTFDTIGDFTGWTANGSSGFGAGGVTGPSAERYQGKFNTFQDISVPAGTYELSVNGYFRSGWAENDWADYLAQQEALAEDPNYVDPTLTAFLYATTSEGTYSVALKHASAGWTDVEYGLDSESQVESNAWIPNTMNAADTYFHTPKVDEQGNEYYPYQVSVILKVGEDQKLRIGVKRDAVADVPAGNWCIVDDFKLTCFGTDSKQTPSGDASGVESIATAEPVSVQYFTVGGARANAAQKGVNIVKKVNADGTVTVSKVLVK